MSLFSFNAIESEINYFLKLADVNENRQGLLEKLNGLFDKIEINFSDQENLKNKISRLNFYSDLAQDDAIKNLFLNILMQANIKTKSVEDLQNEDSFNQLSSLKEKLKIIFRLKITEKTIRELYGYKISDDGTELIPLENPPTITLEEAISQFAPTQVATASKI